MNILSLKSYQKNKNIYSYGIKRINQKTSKKYR